MAEPRLEKPVITTGSRFVKTQQKVDPARTTTPRENFAMPFLSGETAINIVNDVAELANKTADEQAGNDAYDRGLAAQHKAGDEYITTDGTPFTLTGKKYQEGANLAFMNNKVDKSTLHLKLLAKENALNSSAYDEAVKEYKTEWMQGLPSHLQAPLSIKFDSSASTLKEKINVEEFTNNRMEHILENHEHIDILLQDIKGMIHTGDVGPNSSLPAALVDMNKSLQAYKDIYGFSNAQYEVAAKALRNELIVTMARSEYNWKYVDGPLGKTTRVKTTTAERKKIMDGLLAGTYDLGELGETYANQLPGGIELGVLDTNNIIAALLKEETTIKDGFKEQNKEETDLFNKRLEDLRSGKNHKALFTVTPNPHKFIEKMDIESNTTLDIQKWLELGKTEEDLVLMQNQIRQADKVGLIKWQAHYLDLQNPQGFANLKQLTEEVKDAEASGDAKLIRQAKERLNAWKETRAEKVNFVADPDNKGQLHQYLITNLNLADGLDLLENGSDLDKYFAKVERHLNFDTRLVKVFPIETAKRWIGGIIDNSENVDQVKLRLQSVESKIGFKHSITATKAYAELHNRTEDWALLAYHDISKSNEAAGDWLMTSTLKYDINLEIIGAIKNQDENPQKLIDDTVDSIYDADYNGKMGGETSLYKSHKSAFKIVFAEYYANSKNIRIAEQRAKEYMEKNYTEISVDAGNWSFTAIASKLDIPNEENMNAIQKEAKDMWNNPVLYGAKNAYMLSYTDFQNSGEEIKMIMSNGFLQFVNRDSGEPIMFEKLPGDHRANVYADLVLTTNEYWEEKDYYSTNYIQTWGSDAVIAGKSKMKKILDTFEPTKKVKYDTRVGPKTVTEKKSLNEEMEELAKKVDSEINIQDIEYNDWVWAELSEEDTEFSTATDKPILKMISYAFATGNGTDRMLQYLGANYEHLSILENQYARQKLLDDLKNDPNFNYKLSKGLHPERLTPLGVITANVREYTHSDFVQYMPPSIDTDPWLTGP
jgi:hypothetical protein